MSDQLTQDEVAHFAALLDAREASDLAQVERLTVDIAEVTAATRDIPADDEHDPEGSTVTLERAREVALLVSTEKALANIAAARARLEAGTYGRCTSCGNPIPRERLEIRPEAPYCVSCAAKRRN
ncbi:MAG: TraR/DksA family transcriptional regulator [Actinomycetota bacterium]